MKVRSDFVTNSSSSSFILAFTNKDSVKEELLSDMEKVGAIEYYDKVYADVMKHNETKEEAINEFDAEIEWESEWGIEDDFDNDFGWNAWFEAWSGQCPDYLDEFEKRKAEYAEKEKAKFLESIEGKEYFASINYYDDCDPELEGGIIHSLDSTVKWFSHH